MWKAVFEVTHDSCIIAPLCRRHQVTDFVYLVNAWEERDAFYYSEAHIVQGPERAVHKFYADIKKNPSVLKAESSGNFLLTLERKQPWMAAYMPLWDKRLIQVKPVIQRPDGTELWELGCWDKEPLMQILQRLPAEFKIRLRSIAKTKIDQLFLPHVMPKLSDKQRQVIQLAVQQGYYDFPRRIDLRGLAREADVSKPTLQQHLRVAEKKLVPFLTDNFLGGHK